MQVREQAQGIVVEHGDPHAIGRAAYLGETSLATAPMPNSCGDAGFRVISAEPTAHFFETRNPASLALHRGDDVAWA